jgi:hypothetical protein
LRLLSRIVTSRFLQDAFADHRGDPLEAFDYSEGGIAGLLEKERAQFTIEVDVERNLRSICGSSPRDCNRNRTSWWWSVMAIARGASQVRQGIEREMRKQKVGVPHLVCAVPDPHIERWYLEDQRALKAVLPGARPPKLSYRCERGRYKQARRQAIRDAGVEPLLGGAEYGGRYGSHGTAQA